MDNGERVMERENHMLNMLNRAHAEQLVGFTPQEPTKTQHPKKGATI